MNTTIDQEKMMKGLNTVLQTVGLQKEFASYYINKYQPEVYENDDYIIVTIADKTVAKFEKMLLEFSGIDVNSYKEIVRKDVKREFFNSGWEYIPTNEEKSEFLSSFGIFMR